MTFAIDLEKLKPGVIAAEELAFQCMQLQSLLAQARVLIEDARARGVHSPLLNDWQSQILALEGGLETTLECFESQLSK